MEQSEIPDLFTNIHTALILLYKYCYYCSRQGQLLNCRGERTPENAFYRALLMSVQGWDGITLIDYCCAESVLLEGNVS